MNTTKKFTIFAGVNGAGKSTLFNTEKDVNLGIRLNSDEILHDLGLDWKDANAQILAGKNFYNDKKNVLKTENPSTKKPRLAKNLSLKPSNMQKNSDMKFICATSAYAPLK